VQKLCQKLDLCTKPAVPSVSRRARRYKTDSDAKSLILNDFKPCPFSGHLSQALDFSGFGRLQRTAINKVIHINSSAAPKRIEINDLSRLSKNHLNTSA
jgi:hypothetical protein